MSEAKRKWCSVLAKLVAPLDAERAVKAFVAMLPMLPEDDRLFTDRAARNIAVGERRTAVPTFEDLERALKVEAVRLEIEVARQRLPSDLTDEHVMVMISAGRWLKRGAPVDLVVTMLKNTGSSRVLEVFQRLKPEIASAMGARAVPAPSVGKALAASLVSPDAVDRATESLARSRGPAS